MERFEHGGNIYKHAGALDFSASLNPLGIPAPVQRALADSIKDFCAYPDPECSTLRQAIANFENVDSTWVLPTAGATDAISRICHVAAKMHPGGTALVLEPCYSGYIQAAQQAGLTVVSHTLSEAKQFAYDELSIDAIDESIALVFLANPNNPTGSCIEPALLEALLARAQACQTIVALDECFIDLSDGSRSNVYLSRFHNLVIIKALTKTFALAGLRVGYSLCASVSLNEQMQACGQPWAVSSPAQIAGCAALENNEYLEDARALIQSERTRLQNALLHAGMDVVPSQTNYLLFSGPTGLRDEFLQAGILIRSCSNFTGLGEQWYRIAVRTPAENTRFIAALEIIAQKHKGAL